MAYSNQLTNYGSFKYVVTSTEPGPFHTIQSAIDQANTDGATTTILVRPGTYTENLTFYSGINIQGSEEGQVIIVGTHTPPAAGTLTVSRCTLQSDTDIFSSVVAGTAHIILENCTFSCMAGYVFNILNWTGDLRIDNSLELSPENNILNNTGGSFLEILNSTVGTAGGAGMVSSGIISIVNSRIFCSMALANTVTIEGSTIGAALAITGTGNITINNSYLDTESSTSIVTDTTGQVTISDTTINSSADNVIAGSSDVELASVTFLDSNTTVGVTITTSSEFKCNHAHAAEAVTIDNGNFNLTNGMLNINGSTGTNGQIIVAATGAHPAWSTLTSADSSVTFTPGPHTLDLSVNVSDVAWSDATADFTLAVGHGYNINHATPANLMLCTLPATATLGQRIEIVGSTTGGWKVVQNADQYIRLGNQVSTTGVAGYIEFTNQYDSVELTCIVPGASTGWRVTKVIGNITVV